MNSIEVAFACEYDGILHWSYIIFWLDAGLCIRDCEVFHSDKKFDKIGNALEDVLHWIETAF